MMHEHDALSAVLKSDPLTALRRASTVLFAALALGLLAPGIAAWQGGVFYNHDVEKKLGHVEQLREPARQLESFNRETAALDGALHGTSRYLVQVGERLGDTARRVPADEVLAVIRLREALMAEASSRKAPVAASGFYLSNTMLLWPAMFTCLGWLVFVLAPPPAAKRNGPARLAALMLGIWVFYRWPIWARNFLFYRENRVYYGNANFDVDPLGFFVQEGMGLCVTVLLAMLWLRWADFFRQRCEELSTPTDDPIRSALDPNAIDRLSSTFVHWQVSSVVLALGFLWYTYFFWDIVLRTGDLRYTVNALTIHILWLASWALISAPLVLTWYSWQRMKMKALAATVARQGDPGFDAEVTLAALRDTQPVGAWNLAASGVGVAVSFALPLLQALLE